MPDSSYEIITDRLDALIKETHLEESQVAPLRSPELVTTHTLNTDAGKFPAYRIRYNTSRGPGKGGLRFHPAVDEAEVAELAFLMALKTALADIPLGGGKGGVAVDPKQLNEAELEELSRAFIREFANVIGPQIDVPAPDVNTSPQVMAWMLDAYEEIVGHKEPAVITGKPLELGGSAGRASATGRGAYYLLQHYYADADEAPTVAIQGFGNAGQHLARLLTDDDFKIVAISDSSGGVYNPDGIDIAAASEHKADGGSLVEFSGESITNDQLLALEVDLLVPAALGGMITEENAESVQASVIAEVANAPVTAAADELLNEAGVTVIPDILTNAGGVIVSYFEWVQNRSGDRWTESDVFTALAEKMVANYQATAQLACERKLSLRLASYCLAVERIAAADNLRGGN